MTRAAFLMLPLSLLACGDGATSGLQCPVWWVDVDQDGFGDPDFPIEVCAGRVPAGLVSNDDDCHDLEEDIHPGAPEVCDLAQFDEDCDGFANDLDPDFMGGTRTWADVDGDGQGDPGSALVLRCEIPVGRAANSLDCNDDDASTYAGAAYEESDVLCMTDRDDDGYGDETPASGAVFGHDCDDTRDDVYPQAPETVDDGVDQDCDRDVSDWLVEDDFELGEPRPQVIPRLLNAEMSDDFAHSGDWSVKMPAFTNLVFRELDTSRSAEEGWGCFNLTWSFWAKRGPGAPDPGDTVSLQGYDGTSFEDLFVLEGTGLPDSDFVQYRGTVANDRAYHQGLRLRFRASGYESDEFFFIDDVRIACTGPDSDGDGVGVNADCDDADPRHWSDCGQCIDADDDGYGPPPDRDPSTVDSFCDLGNNDCDESDATRSAAAVDSAPDGIDQNCDGIDGPGFVESFESRSVDPDIWSQVSGTWDFQSQFVGRGDAAVHLSGGSEGETVALNTLPCRELGYAFDVQRGPNAPELNDTLTVQWFDGTTWRSEMALAGGADSDLVHYRGLITDVDAAWVAFKARLVAAGDAADDWFVDDFSIGCDPQDADGDGFWDGVEDCDPASPDHWADCGVCEDADGDGFGVSCDRGEG